MVATHFPDQFKSVMKTQDNKKKNDYNDYIHSEGCLVSPSLSKIRSILNGLR